MLSWQTGSDMAPKDPVIGFPTPPDVTRLLLGWSTRDTRLDRIVVLKVLQKSKAAPDWHARQEREARVVSRLNHPHVCALYDIGQEGDIDFLAIRCRRVTVM